VEYESEVAEEQGRVKSLLTKLRIEAEVIIFWLASGSLRTYEVIVNGQSRDRAAWQEVDECLQGQDWWNEIQELRMAKGLTPTAASDRFGARKSRLSDISIADQRDYRLSGLRRLLKRSRRRHSISGLSQLGVNLGMRTQHLHPRLTEDHQNDHSVSEDSASENETLESGPDSAASEGDLSDFISDDEISSLLAKGARVVRRKSQGDSVRGPQHSKRAIGQKEPVFRDSSIRGSLSAMHALKSSTTKQAPGSGASSPTRAAPHVDRTDHSRPSMSRHATLPKFSSRPVPDTKVAAEDGPGPSIMFSDAPSPPTARIARTRLPLAYKSDTTLPGPGGDEIPATPPNTLRQEALRGGHSYDTSHLALSFNDLPSRAQHLILNELFRSQSASTAVMFTTLPAPLAGTGSTEQGSIEYLDDLEVMVKDCPPCMLVCGVGGCVTVSL
jgi:potassium/chloride transporter 9